MSKYCDCLNPYMVTDSDFTNVYEHVFVESKENTPCALIVAEGNEDLCDQVAKCCLG